MIERIVIRNYKHFNKLDLMVNQDINVLVGNNGTGKSTIFEALHLALTGTLRNRPIYQEITPYLFNNETTNDFIKGAKKYRDGEIRSLTPPSIHIELYFTEPND